MNYTLAKRILLTMRLTESKVNEVISQILREEGFPLVAALRNKENVSEFDLAKELSLDIKVVRKMLYLLYNHNLVSFTRKKDKEKGWYIYYWTLESNALRFEYVKLLKKRLLRLEEQFEREQKETFFTCPDDCARLDFDQSMEYDFRCPECGKLLEQEDNTQRKERLEKRIAELQAELDVLHAQHQKKAAAKALELSKERAAEEKAAAKAEAAKKKKKTTKKKVVKKKAAAKKAVKKKTVKKKVSKSKVSKKKVVKKKAAAKKTVKKKTVKKKVSKSKVSKKKVVKKKAAAKKTVKKKTVKKKVSKKKKTSKK